jgi:hypothetical protein
MSTNILKLSNVEQTGITDQRMTDVDNQNSKRPNPRIGLLILVSPSRKYKQEAYRRLIRKTIEVCISEPLEHHERACSPMMASGMVSKEHEWEQCTY